MIVAKERAEEVFEFIYHDAHIDRPHGGIIYMAALTQATQFTLPELPEED
ncbi:MAG: hypothetical protein HOI95_28780 [Chromatiales bacterium]|nr:hypothetical protein [Chromatiales bacterium]